MATILAVDDEDSVRRFLVRILEQRGHSVLEASNGLEAVAIFRSYSKQIDLVLIDMMMPVMDGPQAVARIRETRASIPIICMSGYAPGHIPPGTEFLQKPFSPSTLRELVDQVLAGRG